MSPASRMKVVRDRPPLFDAIDAKFSVRGKPVIFAWGETIFVPQGSLDIHPSLVAHEAVHGERQMRYQEPGEDFQLLQEFRIIAWWQRYIADPAFRREEEVLAHLAEYKHLCDHSGGRNQRRRHLAIVSTKLSHPLYGPMMNKETARKVLSDGHPAYS